MSPLPPDLRDEIADHLRGSTETRHGMVLRDMERGLDVEQIALKQGTSINNVRAYVRGLQGVLSGELPTTPALALKGVRTYRLLLGFNLSPELRNYVTTCIRQLAMVNPEIRLDEPFRPGMLRALESEEPVSVMAVRVDAVPIQVVSVESTDVEKLVSGTVIQREALLVERFQQHLESHGREVMRYRIVPQGSAALYSDLADVTDNIMYEAKGSAERMSVRLALGQVLDYGRYVEGSRLAILLPEEPAADLVELLEAHDVGCVVETPNTFVDLTTLRRCP